MNGLIEIMPRKSKIETVRDGKEAFGSPEISSETWINFSGVSVGVHFIEGADQIEVVILVKTATKKAIIDVLEAPIAIADIGEK